jgi:large subunit ribosomal protein L33
MAKEVRVLVRMECTECHNINYTTEKNTRKQKERIELKKFCPFDKKHTIHKETK